MSEANGRIQQLTRKGAALAAASTLTLGLDGNLYPVSAGTGTINYISTVGLLSGTAFSLLLTGAVIVTNNAGTVPANTAPILLADGASWTGAANQIVRLVYDGTNFVEDNRMRVSTTPWSSLTAPTANLAIAMAARTTTFTWNSATGASDLFTLGDGAANTGTGRMLAITTGAGSTVIPLHVRVGTQTSLYVGSTNDAAQVCVGGTDTNDNSFSIVQWDSGGTNRRAFRIVGCNIAGATAGTEIQTVLFSLAGTIQFQTGAITTQRAFYITPPSYSFVGASTITNAATLAISGPPTAGTNATITNAYTLWVQTGTLAVGAAVRFLGSGSGYTALIAGATPTPTTFTLPAADGSNGQVLQTNGSGVLSFVTAGGSTPTLAAVYTAGGLTVANQTLAIADVLTNTSARVTTVTHSSSGTAAPNFGVEYVSQLQDASGNIPEDAVAVRHVWTVATNGSETSGFRIGLRDTGAAIPAAGSEQYRFTPTFLVIPAGSESVAALTAGGDPDTGVSATAGDFKILSNSALVEFEGSVVDFHSSKLWISTNVASTPSIADRGDQDTGVNWYGSNAIAMCAGGSDIIKITNVSSTLKIGFFNGTPAIQQTCGANVNNCTASGTTGQFDNWDETDPVYTNVKALIKSTVSQLARSVTQLTVTVRNLSLAA